MLTKNNDRLYIINKITWFDIFLGIFAKDPMLREKPVFHEIQHHSWLVSYSSNKFPKTHSVWTEPISGRLCNRDGMEAVAWWWPDIQQETFVTTRGRTWPPTHIDSESLHRMYCDLHVLTRVSQHWRVNTIDRTLCHSIKSQGRCIGREISTPQLLTIESALSFSAGRCRLQVLRVDTVIVG